MGQRATANNLTICYRKEQIGVTFSCIRPAIDNEFRHNIVKVVCRSTRGFIATLTMLYKIDDQ